MGKHLSKQDRDYIEEALNKGQSLRSIASKLNKAVSTVSREVKTHRILDVSGSYGRTRNRCINRKACSLTGLCEVKPDCTRKCSSCIHCNSVCQSFVEESCPKLLSSPYVCNGCQNKPTCVLKKFTYKSVVANEQYRKTLSEVRSGFNLTDSDLNYIDELCSPLIKQGQSIYHVVSAHRDDLLCAQRTLYRLVNASALSARNIDMPRICRMKPRKAKSQTAKIDRGCRINRTIEDFNSFLIKHPDSSFSEMDSVIGRIGGKLLLTIHIKAIDFMLAFLRDHNTAASVEECFSFLHKTLSPEVYHALFSVLLTDNGSEFSNPKAIEYNDNNEKISNVFYCNPSAPYQKPNIELNHEFIRRCIPKGISMDEYSQNEIDFMMSNINSYGREKFGGNSPSQLFVNMFGEDALHLLRQEIIPCDKINLTPSIFQK